LNKASLKRQACWRGGETKKKKKRERGTTTSSPRRRMKKRGRKDERLASRFYFARCRERGPREEEKEEGLFLLLHPIHTIVTRRPGLGAQFPNPRSPSPQTVRREKRGDSSFLSLVAQGKKKVY